MPTSSLFAIVIEQQKATPYCPNRIQIQIKPVVFDVQGNQLTTDFLNYRQLVTLEAFLPRLRKHIEAVIRNPEKFAPAHVVIPSTAEIKRGLAA